MSQAERGTITTEQYVGESRLLQNAYLDNILERADPKYNKTSQAFLKQCDVNHQTIGDDMDEKMRELANQAAKEDNTWEYAFNKEFHSRAHVDEGKADKWKMLAEMGDAVGWRKLRAGPPKDSHIFWKPPTKVLYSKRTLKEFPNLLGETQK